MHGSHLWYVCTMLGMRLNDCHQRLTPPRPFQRAAGRSLAAEDVNHVRYGAGNKSTFLPLHGWILQPSLGEPQPIFHIKSLWARTRLGTRRVEGKMAGQMAGHLPSADGNRFTPHQPLKGPRSSPAMKRIPSTSIVVAPC